MRINLREREFGLFILVPKDIKTSKIAEALGHQFSTNQEQHKVLVRTLRILKNPERFPIWRIKEFADLIKVDVVQVLFVVLKAIIKKHHEDWASYIDLGQILNISHSPIPSLTEKVDKMLSLCESIQAQLEQLKS